MSEIRVQQCEAGVVMDVGKSSAPTAADLARIREFALGEVDAATLYVRRVMLCSDAVDRAYGQIPLPYLQRLAATLPGKSLLLNHDKYFDAVAVGLWHHAEARASRHGEPGSNVLEAHFYLVRDEDNATLIRRIDAGIVRHCSIAFTYDHEVCDVCSLPYYKCPHHRGERLEDGRKATFRFGGDVEKYEAVEGSLVYLGRQHGSTIRTGHDPAQGEEMELEKILAAINSLGQTLEAKMSAAVAAAVAAVPSPAATAEPVVEAAAHADQALAEDGKAYRADLTARIDHAAGLLKCEVQAKRAVKGCATAAELKELAAEYEALVEERFPNTPVGRTEGEVAGQQAQEPESRQHARLF
jgi:hypothetical protein